LKTLGYSAVNFVITGNSIEQKESDYYLNQSEIKQMIKTGRWEIGAHSHKGHISVPIDAVGTKGHFFSDKLWLANQNRIETEEEFKKRIADDLQTSKKLLEENLGIEVIGFAFPFGDYGQESIHSLDAAGTVIDNAKSLFPLSFYQVRAGESLQKRNYPGIDIPLVKRIGVKSDWSAERLLDELEQSADKMLPFTDTFETNKGWISLWGGLERNSATLRLFTLPSSTSAFTLLQGSTLFTDINFNADTTLKQGETYSLIARFTDPKNYIHCKFGDERFALEQVHNGEITTLRSWHDTFSSIKKSDVNLAIQIEGNTVSCLLNEKVVLRANNVVLPPHGSIALSTWSPEIDGSEMNIKKINVTKK